MDLSSQSATVNDKGETLVEKIAGDKQTSRGNGLKQTLKSYVGFF